MSKKVPEADFRAVYEQFRKGRLSRRAAIAQLGMSERSFRRYATGLRTQGSQWWEERPRRPPPSSRAPDEERERVRRLYADRYAGWYVRHYYEKYRDKHGGKRSYTWVKDVLQTAGLVERRMRNDTPMGVSGKDARKSIGRQAREGMLLHLISSRGEWSVACTWDLVLTVDDATNRVHSGFFVGESRIWSAFKAIRETLVMKGTFDSLSLGVALPARLTVADSAFGGRTRPQLERAALEVCSQLVPSEPELRTRQMRMIGTLRGRLSRELAAEGIADIHLANDFLGRFWPRFNEALGKASQSPSVFDPLSPGTAKGLEDVLCLKHQARFCEGPRLLCEGMKVEIPGRKRQDPSGSREYRIHEYEDGRRRVFSRGTTGLDRLTWTELT